MIFLLFSTSVKAQEQPGLRDRANQLYSEYQYAKAVVIYLKLVDKENPKLEDMEKLAFSYFQMNNFKASENWYAQVTRNSKSDPENLIYYGETLKANARYTEAKEVFLQYASKTGNREKVTNNISGCDSALVWMANPQAYVLKNESAINTPLSEFSAFLYKDLVYYAGEPQNSGFKNTYGWTGNSYLRIYTSELKKDQNLSSPKIFDASVNNDAYHSGPLAVSKNGNMLFVTRTYPGKKTELSKEKRNKHKTNNLELFIYTKNTKTKGWDSKPFAYNDVMHYSVGHAALSTDEKTLYFVSDMAGGFGGTDIWYCELQSDGKWGQPYNAGSVINSAGDEMFPNISADGALYYSSNGLPGMGGLDIFNAKGQRNSWSTPLNLKFPANSSMDDFSFVTNEVAASDTLTGYLSSNRTGGKGADDIYSFKAVNVKKVDATAISTEGDSKSQVTFALKGTVSNKTTHKLMAGAKITLFGNEGQLVAKQKSNADGTFYFVLKESTDYKVLGQNVKFYSDYARVSTKGLSHSDTLLVALRLDPLDEIGKTIALQNIHYDLDKADIRPDAQEVLIELVNTMLDNPTLKIELASHTDSRGSDSHNKDLSQRRAQSAVNYLVSQGIDRSRMVAKGYGETQLLNRCANGVSCSEAEHQANRRTEFKILKY